MADYTDEVETECEKDVVFAIDVLDVGRRLLHQHISLDQTMSQCGIGPTKSAYLQKWVNKRRTYDGEEALPANTITPATTIREVIGHVC